LAEKTGAKVTEEDLSPDQIKKRLDALDQRLDAIDTMVTAVAERMMSRPLSVTVTCPSCGQIIEIAIVGNEKMMR